MAKAKAKAKTKKELWPLEGPGKHSGRKHPPIEKVEDAKETKGATRKAVAAREHLETRS
jgi:hypothetical protein